MCTLTYIPKKDGGFYMTHNRDEAVYRNDKNEPKKFIINDLAVVSPIDTESGGTWISLANNGTIACLLNGGFEKHKRELPYRHSRGVIIFDFFNYHGLHDFMVNYDLSNIEPFTMVIYHNEELFEVVWDGEQKHLKKLDKTIPHIYSSTTLYNEEMKEERENWFKSWISEVKSPNLTDILHFHKTAGAGNSDYGLVMQRGDILRTVSIAGIERSEKELNLIYENLVDKRITKHRLKLKHQDFLV